jgi:hypothetical protein
MWHHNDPKSPRGQMIVIVAFALTVLIAMAGLIIDGGMAWSNRRQVQNAADSASLAGTRVLGLDLKWRAVNAGNPSPPPAPFPNPDAAVCDAINNALAYNTNSAQSIPAIDCFAGSDDATYVDFARNELGRVGDGIPFRAQGVKVQGTGASNTFLMGVVGISTIDVHADATALAGPGEPPLGLLMPFVAQNPLGPFVPGNQYQIRSEDEGECDTASLPTNLASAPQDSGIVLASYVEAAEQPAHVFAAPPAVPVASPPAQNFGLSITVALSAANGAKIHYTTDGVTPPTAASPQYASPLTFTTTTTLKAVAIKGGQTSEIGTFTYTQDTPPAAVTATPADGTVFTGSQLVTLSTATGGATIRYTTNGTNPTTSSPVYGGAFTVNATTQVRAIAVAATGVSSGVSTFNYIRQGDTEPPEANPPTGTEFQTSQNVTLTSPTSGATIYYTVDGSAPTTSSTQYVGPISLVSTTTIRAFARALTSSSLIVDFTYTKLGPVCPELTEGNFGWIDYSGGSNSNADLKDQITHPENASIDWYYRSCTGVNDSNCRDVHTIDPADDHWLVEGTPGHRDSSLREVCDLYLGEIVYVPIWDDFNMLATKKPNGNNAVFHIIGFAAFRIDGVIDNKNNGDPSGDACGAGVGLGGTPNDKGFVGTYVDSFVGTQVAPCIPSVDGTNPCSNLQNDRLEINLAD